MTKSNVICAGNTLSGGYIPRCRCHVVVKFAIGSSGGVAGYLTLQGIVRLSGIYYPIPNLIELTVVDPIGEDSMSPPFHVVALGVC